MEQNGMNIALIAEQLAYIELTIDTIDEFDVYGGTTRAGFEFEQVGTAQWHITVRESEVAGSALRPFDIYARQHSTGREWVVLSGKIIVKPRTADIGGDKLSPVEYHVSVPVVDSVLETQGMAIVTGIPGPQGPQGPKGDPGDGNVTPEAIQAVAPIAWGKFDTAPTLKNEYSVAFGNKTASGSDSVALGSGTHAADYSVSVGASVSAYNGAYSTQVGYKTKTIAPNTVTVGSYFRDTSGNYTCQTQGTGSITIGAGANTLNNGSTESSNSITIGCKASNSGADSVVIGAGAKGGGKNCVIIGAGRASNYNNATCIGGVSIVNGANGIAIGGGTASLLSVAIGNAANTASYAIAIGYGAKAPSENSISLGVGANANNKESVAIGRNTKVADYGAVAFRSTAEDGTYTQLYFSGANTPLANTYHGGAPMLGYVTKDSAGNIVAAGTRSLIELLTDNSTFAPASLDENGEWVMPKVFHPSDLDLPVEEPSEPEEYQPLPVYPIVEPTEDELRTPTQAD